MLSTVRNLIRWRTLIVFDIADLEVSFSGFIINDEGSFTRHLLAHTDVVFIFYSGAENALQTLTCLLVLNNQLEVGLREFYLRNNLAAIFTLRGVD